MSKRPELQEWHSEDGQNFVQYVAYREKRLGDLGSAIDILPLGDFNDQQQEIIRKTAEFIGDFFGVQVRVHKTRPLGIVPDFARRIENGEEQVLVPWINEMLLKPNKNRDAIATVCLVTSELWHVGQNWKFDSASMKDQVGVWSLRRNGDPRVDEEAFRICLRRTVRTAVHEIGHMLGIPHCIAYECCMNGSYNCEESDGQPLEFCPECQPKIWWSCRAAPVKRCQKLLEFCEREGLKPEAEFWRVECELIE